MELKITDIPPTICLNMIVKNESHIIKDTLEMLCSKINFSYWVICDTGSTDNTKTIISQFFEDKNIPGELHNHTWKNFAHNRTLALEVAFNKTDLLFIFDADDEIHGNIKIPTKVNSDGYLLNFGSSAGISYQRVLLVNNRIKWNYLSVIHEFINCLKPNAKIVTLEGDYYIVSGRRGSRNLDPEKYIKDAKILEEAYHEAKKKDDKIFLRYGFYCANSYKDAGKSVEAIKWYKITLNNENWLQEKYMCCLYLFNEYNTIGEKEKALYYLVESIKYDTERMECIYYLVNHYGLCGLNNLAYAYYGLIKDFYENKYLQSNINGKLFVEPDKANFYLPYYMIIVADKVKEFIPEATNTIIKMFVIIFTKKHPINDYFFIGNLLYNLQFFIDCCVSSNGFITLFQNYILFLEDSININLYNYQFLKQFEKYGIKFKCFQQITNNFSYEECKNSKTILFYAGFANLPWNYTYSVNNALGGSETAVVNLASSFPKDFQIYIGGAVSEETVGNITYINLDNLRNLVKIIPFHTVIVSRYIAFYEMFPETSFYQSFIWGHDIELKPYGCNLDVNSILNKWNAKINGCVCQTEWHKNLFAKQYPQIKDKIVTINNGILTDKFIYEPIKFINRFIYTSCAERGLERLLELWPQIIKELPDAELYIASYNKFPQNDFEIQLDNIIKRYDSIKHFGTLNRDKLYELMSSAEFWLYPTNFNETSCITSMEMLMSEVVCLYYPVAGLVNTLGEYGIKIQRNNEINTILSLSTKQKNDIRRKGKEYALQCSWNNRAQEWCNLLNINNIIDANIDNNVQRMFDLFDNISMPEEHKRTLQNISKTYIFNEHQDVNINLPTLHIYDQFMTHSNKKYKLSACLMIKNETENLIDWLEHYIKQGVEHFFILSNNSSDNIEELIEHSSHKNMITFLTDNRDLNIYNNAVEHRQILCDNFYRIVKMTSVWSILVDIDEFMSGKNGYTLSSFIDTIQPDIGCVYVYWNMFKPTIDLDGNITEKFERKKSNKRINLDLLKELSYEINFVSKFGKSLFRTSMLNDNIKLWIHKVQTNGKIITNYGNNSDYKYDNDDNIVWSEDNYKQLNIVLNHYVIRNKKDYERKMSQLENTHRYTFIKGALDIISLDDIYFVEDNVN